MLKHVHFEVFGQLEGEIAFNTAISFVFSLHFHGIFLVQLVLLLSIRPQGCGITETAKTILKL